MKKESKFWNVGDIVTRGDGDEYEILSLDDRGANCMIIRCVKEPGISEFVTKPYIRQGEEKYDLIERYSFLRPGKSSS